MSGVRKFEPPQELLDAQNQLNSAFDTAAGSTAKAAESARLADLAIGQSSRDSSTAATDANALGDAIANYKTVIDKVYTLPAAPSPMLRPTPQVKRA